MAEDTTDSTDTADTADTADTGSAIGTRTGRTSRSGRSKNYTAPKGRPTRPRSAVQDRRRIFGPVAQWIAFGVLLLIAIVVLIIVTDGGDFNPFDDVTTGAPPPTGPRFGSYPHHFPDQNS
jgi:hypothetical protein